MASLTRNLFWGQGERSHRLRVVAGQWPRDMTGAVFVIGPDKRRPGGHWFAEPGLLCRIGLELGGDGRLPVDLRLVRTPLLRLRARARFLFRTMLFMEVSPFGVSNLANTNVQAIADRLFIGYDAGRPIEVDPVTLDTVTPVGANDEWLQAMPGLLEPLVMVAAHPAADFEDGSLSFVNYSPLPGAGETWIAQWDLDGPVRRWKLDGVAELESVHDIKVTRDYLVFSDLPFVFEPQVLQGRPPSRPNRDFTTLTIVRKSDLRATPAGGTVHATQVRIPMPTGHLSVDYENPDGEVRVFLEHIPIADLMIMLGRDDVACGNGMPVDPNHEGLVTLAVQPGAVGRYRIDVDAAEVREADIAWDERFWGAVLATRDESTPAARRRLTKLWYSGLGFDPELVPQTWWDLYASAGLACLVDPADLPRETVPAALAAFDLEAMKVTELHQFGPGEFASPPTFVPRRGAGEPGDGYVVVIVHKDGPKEIQVFDAGEIERGPIARATAPDFSPPLLLHSCWMAPRRGPRPSAYRVPVWRDVAGALKRIPAHVRTLAKVGREQAALARSVR